MKNKDDHFKSFADLVIFKENNDADAESSRIYTMKRKIMVPFEIFSPDTNLSNANKREIRIDIYIDFHLIETTRHFD